MRCPGQDMRFWKPGDIFEVRCPACERNIEFFKDDVRRTCRCGREMVNPRLDLGCAGWCPYAEQCVGVVPEEGMAKGSEDQKGLLKEKISLEMKRYFGKDLKRVKHAAKVAGYAEQILKMEGGNALVVLGAAYLHDIGIHEAERKNGSRLGRYQELEGPAIAREILNKLGVEEKIVDEICDIIGHHHSPRDEETLNFRILYEADGLVNIDEEGLSRDHEETKGLIEKVFRTATGKELAERLYLSEHA